MSVSTPTSTLDARRLTVDEWAAMDEDEPGELVDGVLVEEEMPDLVHEVALAWLFGILQGWLRPLGGLVVGSEAKFAVSTARGRKPDLSAWFPGHPRLPGRGAVRIPPDLVVEVVSPGSSNAKRDRIDKAADYAAFGVRWYWLVDPESRALEILERGAEGRYVRALASERGRIENVPGCEGLVLDLDALWAEIDELDLSEASGQE